MRPSFRKLPARTLRLRDRRKQSNGSSKQEYPVIGYVRAFARSTAGQRSRLRERAGRGMSVRFGHAGTFGMDCADGEGR